MRTFNLDYSVQLQMCELAKKLGKNMIGSGRHKEVTLQISWNYPSEYSGTVSNPTRNPKVVNGADCTGQK